MNTERMIAYYEANNHWLGPPQRARAIAAALTACHTILDVGAGDGRLLAELRSQGAQPRYTGLDCVPKHHEASRVRYPEAEWILADFMAWDPGGRRFDGVAACSLFTGAGWETDEIAPAIRKLVSLTIGRLAICNNAWFAEIREACGAFDATEIVTPGEPDSRLFLIDRIPIESLEVPCIHPIA